MTSNSKQSIFKSIDWILVLLYCIMVTWGWTNIFSTEYVGHSFNIFDMSFNYGKQFIWVIISFSLAFVILLIDARFFSTFAIPIYIAMMMLLLSVLVVGSEVAGSKSWLIISNNIRIQPSEFAKVALSLVIAHYLSRPFKSLQSIKDQMVCIGLILLPTIFILLQKDTGTAIVFVAFFMVFYREGWSYVLYVLVFWFVILFVFTLLINEFILLGILFCLFLFFSWLYRKLPRKKLLHLFLLFCFSVFFVFSVDYIFDELLRPHQKDRIMVLLGKEVDPRGVGYNINQSLIAIGSGGISGKGYLKGTQTKYNFVPEQSTDFIFCTIGEEWGFFGSILLISLFLTLLIRIVILSEKQRSDFSRIYGYSVASVIFIHFFINIGMTINLLPIIGIPLPFFSYGGSSLIAFTCLLFIFIKLNSRKNDLI
jgi:rod shape determining protein RodA